MATAEPSAAPQFPEGIRLLAELASLSDAEPRDLGQEQITLIRRALEDPDWGMFFFCRFIFGYPDVTQDLHLPICRLIGRWGQSLLLGGETIDTPPGENDDVVDSYRRLMFCIPRDHLKTSVCTRAGSLWIIARDPTHNATIGIFNEKEDNSVKWVDAIKDVVESSYLFQVLWREMIPKGVGYWDRDKGITRPRDWKWGGHGLRFVRDSRGTAELSIEPHGIGGAATGKHFSHIIKDDIIGLEASRSKAVMTAANEWMDNSRNLELPAGKGCELICYTPWGYSDTYVKNLRSWPEDYKVYKRAALENDEGDPDATNGKSIFPRRFTTAQIQKIHKRKPHVFWPQQMCIPRAGEQLDFNEQWVRWGSVELIGAEPVFSIDKEHYDPEIIHQDCEEGDRAPQHIPLSMMSKCVILDPAPSKETEIRKDYSAYNGCAIVGRDPWGRRYLLGCWEENTGPVDILRKIMSSCEAWHTRRFSIEEVNFSAIYYPFFQYVIRNEYDWEPEYTPCFTKGRDKLERIKGNLGGPLENGFWYYNRQGTARALQQLLEFPNGERLDILDAQSYTDEVCERPETPSEQLQFAHRQYRERQSRGRTGYGDFFGEDYG